MENSDLTEAQKDYLRREGLLKEDPSDEVDTKEVDSSIEDKISNSETPPNEKESLEGISRPFYKRPSMWAALVITLGMLGIATILLLIFRVDSILGPGVIDYLSTQNLDDPEVKRAVELTGSAWILDVIKIYSSRYLFIGAIALVTLLLAGALIFWEYRITRREEKKRRETAREEVSSVE